MYASVVNPYWVRDCLHWWGTILTGTQGHWCPDWDDLPIDETCEEFEFCQCERKGDDE